MSDEQREEIELPLSYAVIQLPEHTVELKLTATILENGGLMKVESTMDMKQVWDAFREAEEAYIPDDAVFTLTEKGRRWLEEHQAEADQ